MVHYPVRIKSAEVVLQVRQEQRVHPECIDQHVVGTLNREETDVYGIADEPVRTFYLIAADFLRLEQFPAAAEEERFAGREQFGERFKVVHFQIGTFQRRQAAGKEVRSEHTVPAFLKDTVTAFLAVPHLAPGEVVHGLSVKVHARSHQELHGCFPVLKLHHVVQSCDEDRLVITFAAFYIAEMLPAYISHPLRIRQFNRFLEQKVYK